MSLTDGGTLAWIIGALVALVVVAGAVWIALSYGNDEEIV